MSSRRIKRRKWIVQSVLKPLLLLVAIWVVPGPAGAQDWSLVRDQDGVEVYLRPFQGSPIKAVRAEMRVQADTVRILALLRDASRHPQWDERCSEGSVYKKLGEHEELHYYRYHLPWPASDREMLARFNWMEDPAAHSVVITSDAIPGQIRSSPGLVRVTDSTAQWVLTSLPDGRTGVEASFHGEPGGPLPGWLINNLLVDSPFRSFVRLRALLQPGENAVQ